MEMTYSLHLIHAFEPGSRPKLIRTLTINETQRIAAFFRREEQSANDTSQTVAMLQSMQDKRQWLACGCGGALGAASAILFPRALPRGVHRKATLVPNYDRGSHRSDCALGRARIDATDAPAIRERPALAGGLGILRAKSTLGGNRSGTRQTGVAPVKRQRSTPSLATVLFTLFEQAGFNVLTARQQSDTDAKNHLRTVMGRLFLDGVGKRPVRDWCELSFATASRLQRRIDQEDDASWGKLRPQGFVMDRVRDYRSKAGSHVLTNLYGDQLCFDGRLYVPGEETPGPWMAIGVMCRDSETGLVAVQRTYLHPLRGDNDFYLVDSDLERHTAALLAVHLAKMQLAGKPYRVIKPLLDLSVPGGEHGSARPDFIVSNCKGDNLVVETMGYDDPDYLERKALTHQRMRLLPGVIALVEHRKGTDHALRGRLTLHLG